MFQEKNLEYKVYDVRCRDVLEEEGVRFAAIIDSEGKMIAGGFKKGITPLEGDEKRLQQFMEFSANISLRKDYDRNLGALNYIAFRRDRIILVSFPFPLSPLILLISAEPSDNIEKRAERVTRIVGDSKLFSEWDRPST